MRPLQDVEPVRKIQAAYFELLRHFFGQVYEEMRKHNVSPAAIASDFFSNEWRVKAFHDESPALLQAFVEFWETRQNTVEEYLRKVEVMKSFFGGDISPQVELNHLSSTLLYTDTVVLQCPVLRMIPIVEMGPPEEACRLLLKHALNVMRFEELAIADVEPPILLVTGSSFSVDEEYRENLTQATEVYVLAQAKALLDRDFSNSEDLRKFISGLKTNEDAIRAIANPRRALFDTDWSGSLSEQFQRNTQELVGLIKLPAGMNSAGFAIHNLLSGRMLQANELVLLNSSIGATPLLSAPTSWQYLLWRYEFDAAAISQNMDPRDLVVTNAIMTRGDRNEIPLIAGLSPKNIVALRKEGAIAPIREIMRKSIKRIDLASQSELKQISDEVSRELGEAFDNHDRELTELQAGKKRFYGVDVASFVATGALIVAGAATGNVPLQITGALSGLLFGSKSAFTIKDTLAEMKAKERQIKRSPTAILLRNIDK